MNEDDARWEPNFPYRKASFSGPYGNCVEVAKYEAVMVRNSREPDGPVLFFTMDEWAAFLLGAKHNEFDID